MISLNIQFVPKNEMISWSETKPENTIHMGNGSPPIQVAVLEGGMTNGKPSIMLRIDLPDGKTVLAETSARLLCIAAKAIMARYPVLFDD